MRRFLLTAAFVLTVFAPVFSQIPYPGKVPGKARVTHRGDSLVLENDALRMSFVGGRPVAFLDKRNGRSVALGKSGWFSLVLGDRRVATDKRFRLNGGVGASQAADVSGSATTDRPGVSLTAGFTDSATGLTLDWKAWLGDDANYVRQRFVFRSKDPIQIDRYVMVELPSRSEAHGLASSPVAQLGAVDGSPVVSGNLFFALEHPMSETMKQPSGIGVFVPRQAPLQSGDSLVLTTVCGTTPAGQLRRGFLYYLERTRSHPYRPFLHYVSWFDLSWVDRKLDESSCLERIRTFGDSLVRARHVTLKAFMFDDGWDNDSTLWQISRSFPNGFQPLRQLADTYGVGLGVWISPWGGYDPQKAERVAYGRKQHPAFETNKNGFSLAGPVYFNRFREVTTRFIKDDDVRIFKFDGVGAGNGASGAGLSYQKDIDALLRLTRDLKKTEPDLFLSLTVGTWPSPYWLFYGDAIWRAGDDFGFAGKGTKRQQWINYRNGQNYVNNVLRAPLYPLNSVMLHGICIAPLGPPGTLDLSEEDIADEIWDYFASGTGLQELCVDPDLLTTDMWDQLAGGARWSAANADVFPDVHWIGGDPGKDEVYGYAAWAPRKGVLSLRNPSTETKTFLLDIGRAFGLPQGAARTYRLSDPRRASPAMRLSAGTPVRITLAPHELLVWDAWPTK